MIPQVLGIGQMFLTLAQRLDPSSQEFTEAQKVLSTIGGIHQTLTVSSASESAGKLLIAPITAIEQSLIHQEYMNDLMVVINLRDIKDVLAHLALQCKVNGISVGDIVGGINPNRGGLMSLTGLEAFDPTASIIPEVTYCGMEANGQPSSPSTENEKKVMIGGKSYTELNEFGALAVGRTVDASVSIDGMPLNFPLTFRQVPMPVPTNDIENMFTAARPKDGFFARIRGWQVGEYSSPAFFTGIDEIKQEFKVRNNDMSGYYTEAHRRAEDNRLASIRTGVVSMNTAANTIILSAETARQIEIEMGRSFDGPGIAEIRKAVLANTIVIVDDGQGIFKFYTGNARVPEKYTRKEITVKSKKENGIDLPSLLKLFGSR